MRVRSRSSRLLATALLLAGLWAGTGIGLPAAGAADTVPAEARTAFERYRANEPKAALASSRRAVELHETSNVAWRVRGFILSKTGDRQGAIAAYVRAIRLNPIDAIARNNLGTILIEVGDYEAALKTIDAALVVDPRYADALNNRGVVLGHLKRAREAEAAYAAAIRADPKHAPAYNNRGAVQLRRGDKAGARASFERAAALDPRFAAPALNLALLRDPALQDETAYRTLLAAAERAGAGTALRARALGARAARESDAEHWDAARALYLQALELLPRDVNLLNNVAVVEDQLGMDRFAILHLDAALRARPGFSVARNNRGIVRVHRGDLKAAKREFESLIRDDPRFHRAHYNLGVIQASEGDIESARRTFRVAARLAPNDASVRYNLGLLAHESGAGLEAERQAYAEALALDERLAEAHLSLGGLLADPETPAEMRDEAAARRHFLRFLELTPAGDDDGRAQARQWLAWLDSLHVPRQMR